ncbi:hypothetical protein EJB05_18727, partial [Eragrostis curvula]
MSATTAAAVRRLCAAGEVRSALAVLARGAKAGDATLDVAACTALVHGCCKSGDLAEARRVFDLMPRLGVIPNEVTYTALIHGYFVQGQREMALALFAEMRSGGVEPNLYTYNCLIGECYGLTIRLLCNEGKCQEAEALIDDMKSVGLQTSESVCRVLLDAKARLDGTSATTYLAAEDCVSLKVNAYAYEITLHQHATNGRLPAKVLREWF